MTTKCKICGCELKGRQRMYCSKCKSEVRKEQKKQYKIDNKEKLADYKKQYNIDNKEKFAQYYIDNKEKIAQYNIDNKEKRAQYYIDNKENAKQYYIDNKEKIAQYRVDNKEKAKQYAIDNKEQIAEKNKQYYIDNKEKLAQYYEDTRDPNITRKGSKECRIKMSAAQQGISIDEWDGFATNSPYCEKFNESCRESNRDKYDRECFICGKSESENFTKSGKQRKLSVHHIDMNKQQGCNDNEWKLVPVCLKHHGMLHTELWEARIKYLLRNL